MSRRSADQNKPNMHVNCVTEQNDVTKTLAIRSKREHDKWEAKQIFEVIRPDSKTTIFRAIKPGEKVKNKKQTHKGKI